MAFRGSCHCGAVKFSVDADLPTQGMSCNCSMCRRKGSLLAFFPVVKFKLDSGATPLQTYRFNTHKLAHKFCGTCGIHPFAEGTGPDGAEMRAVNLRCVPDVDLEKLTVQHYDGAAH